MLSPHFADFQLLFFVCDTAARYNVDKVLSRCPAFPARRSYRRLRRRTFYRRLQERNNFGSATFIQTVCDTIIVTSDMPLILTIKVYLVLHEFTY